MTIRRAAAALSTAALLLLAVAGPALAETTPRYEGQDPAPPMTPLVAVLVFVGIPAAVSSPWSWLLVIGPVVDPRRPLPARDGLVRRAAVDQRPVGHRRQRCGRAAGAGRGGGPNADRR